MLTSVSMSYQMSRADEQSRDCEDDRLHVVVVDMRDTRCCVCMYVMVYVVVDETRDTRYCGPSLDGSASANSVTYQTSQIHVATWRLTALWCQISLNYLGMIAHKGDGTRYRWEQGNS